jgi:F-type H+-transporting ATPase subunit a
VKVIHYIKFISLALLLSITVSASCQEDTAVSTEAVTTEVKTNEVEAAEVKSEKFNPAPMIMEHIADAHEFHIAGHLHIPLPCILYNRAEGKLDVFSSSKLEEGYNGYKYSEETEEDKIKHIEREDKAAFLDFSITKNVFSMMVGATLLLLIFFSVAGSYKTRKNQAPKGLQSLIEPLVVFVRDDIAKPGLGKHYEKFLPYLMTAFFFILINNLLGLIPIFPGGANVTGNIAVTLVLALFTGILINVNGTKDYWKHIFTPPVPIPLYILMVPVEVIGVITKPVTLMIRLFANITAGHIIVLSLVSLIFVFGNYNEATDVVGSPAGAGLGSVVAVLFTLFISVIELLVAFIQAFIFTMLSSVFLGMALEEHEHAEHH